MVRERETDAGSLICPNGARHTVVLGLVKLHKAPNPDPERRSSWLGLASPSSFESHGSYGGSSDGENWRSKVAVGIGCPGALAATRTVFRGY